MLNRGRLVGVHDACGPDRSVAILISMKRQTRTQPALRLVAGFRVEQVVWCVRKYM